MRYLSFDIETLSNNTGKHDFLLICFKEERTSLEQQVMRVPLELLLKFLKDKSILNVDV